jgi:hypothetical protein
MASPSWGFLFGKPDTFHLSIFLHRIQGGFLLADQPENLFPR